AGHAVAVGILAGLVDVEGMVGVLEGRDLQAPPHEAGDHLGEQRGFARAAPAGEADDAHGGHYRQRCRTAAALSAVMPAATGIQYVLSRADRTTKAAGYWVPARREPSISAFTRVFDALSGLAWPGRQR